MQPKTKERMSNFRRANRKMPRRRVDIPVEKISYTKESGKLIPRRITGLPAWLHRVVVREIKRSRAVNLMP